jgi:hypothetical protein
VGRTVASLVVLIAALLGIATGVRARPDAPPPRVLTVKDLPKACQEPVGMFLVTRGQPEAAAMKALAKKFTARHPQAFITFSAVRGDVMCANGARVRIDAAAIRLPTHDPSTGRLYVPVGFIGLMLQRAHPTLTYVPPPTRTSH